MPFGWWMRISDCWNFSTAAQVLHYYSGFQTAVLWVCNKVLCFNIDNFPLQKSPNTLGVSRKQCLQLLLSARGTLDQQVKILFGEDISEHILLLQLQCCYNHHQAKCQKCHIQYRKCRLISWLVCYNLIESWHNFEAVTILKFCTEIKTAEVLRSIPLRQTSYVLQLRNEWRHDRPQLGQIVGLGNPKTQPLEWHRSGNWDQLFSLTSQCHALWGQIF